MYIYSIEGFFCGKFVVVVCKYLVLYCELWYIVGVSGGGWLYCEQ
jgi:hypothetical protein